MPKERGDGTSTRRRRLTRDDWTAAALEALGGGGITAVAVEPLAARLGTTKGSAYWHFRDREELLAATLERWEAQQTEAVIAAVEAEADTPERRLRVLFSSVLRHVRPNAVEPALSAAVSEPLVAAALQRVAERRVGYLEQLFVDLGFDRRGARDRAVMAYAMYLGHLQLMRGTPTIAPSGRDGSRSDQRSDQRSDSRSDARSGAQASAPTELQRYIDDIVDLLTAR